MRFPLSFRVARACALATFIVSLGLTPSWAHMGGGTGPAVRPGSGFGHSQHFAPHGFDRGLKDGRFVFNRFGPDRLDRFGYNRFGRNQLLAGGGWGWGGFPGSTDAYHPFFVGEGAPVIINIGIDPGPGDTGGALSGGCVIHTLNYDNTGRFVGERQIPHC